MHQGVLVSEDCEKWCLHRKHHLPIFSHGDTHSDCADYADISTEDNHSEHGSLTVTPNTLAI